MNSNTWKWENLNSNQTPLSLSEGHNPNYVAKVVIIDNIEKHPNADRLQLTRIDGMPVIVDMTTRVGDLMVYVPLECVLNHEFLHMRNMFASSSLNVDTEKNGYIHNTGRVRAVSLRGVVSSGLLIDIKSLDPIGVIDWKTEVNTVFDTIGNNLLLKKYVPKGKEPRNNNNETEQTKKKTKKRYFEDFEFHCKTSKLEPNLHVFRQNNMSDGTLISISEKLHGTSGIAANLNEVELVPKWKQFLVKLLIGVRVNKIMRPEYVASSRSVFRGYESGTTVWHWALEQLKPYIDNGMTIYYEAVGYMPGTNTLIQKGYDYGCEVGKCKLFIYRITQVMPSGVKREYSTKQIVEFCKDNNLNNVPMIHYNTPFEELKNIYNATGILDIIHKQTHWEKNDRLCNNQVPAEGYIVRIEGSTYRAFKAKCTKFLLRETKELDSAEENIEDCN